MFEVSEESAIQGLVLLGRTREQAQAELRQTKKLQEIKEFNDWCDSDEWD